MMCLYIVCLSCLSYSVDFIVHCFTRDLAKTAAYLHLDVDAQKSKRGNHERAGELADMAADVSLGAEIRNV